jgi:transcription-repair coupling factor (superfamily II helicase)
LRDISIIETRPRGGVRSGRSSGSTTTLVRALEREHAEGQSYLHNRVESIDEAAGSTAVSGARFSRTPMAERARGADARLLAGDADVLVSTTIIESGSTSRKPTH